MSRNTSIADQIDGLVKRLEGALICDDCVADRLYLSARSQADIVTRGLAGRSGFKRDKDTCAFCKVAKTVIRYRK